MQSLTTKRLIETALAEDIGSGDITTDNLVDAQQIGAGVIIAKEPLVLAGIEIARQVFNHLDSGKLPKAAMLDAMMAYAKGKFDLDAYKGADAGEIEAEIKKIVEKNKGKPFGALMGMAMAKFQGKADGKVVSELLKKYL